MEKSAAEQVAGAHWRCHVLHLAGLLSLGARPAFSPGPLFSFCSVSLSFLALSPPPPFDHYLESHVLFVWQS